MVNNPTVLLVGHDAVNLSMIELACSDQPSRPRCQNAYDATEALNFVQNARNPLTNLIIIDLDTVGDSGMMLLEALKNGADTRSIPVLIMAKEGTELTVKEAYRLGCGGFFAKPESIDVWRHVLEIITEYWFTHCQGPKDRD